MLLQKSSSAQQGLDLKKSLETTKQKFPGLCTSLVSVTPKITYKIMHVHGVDSVFGDTSYVIFVTFLSHLQL